MENTEDLVTKYQSLVSRREKLKQDFIRVETVLEGHKKELREAMDECNKAGFNPNNLVEEYKKAREVLALKLNNLEADIKVAEDLITPMLREIA